MSRIAAAAYFNPQLKMDTMDLSKTALLMIGFQNDYFSPNGILHSVIEESAAVTGALKNTLALLKSQGENFGLVLSTPILFTEDYEELKDAVGILETIKEVGAFKAGSLGAQAISELGPFSELITEIPGKRGLNAFSNTALASTLAASGIEEIVLVGAITSVCIDSTGRHAAELGYRVMVLNDCTSGRTSFEHDFYCESIFPLYASVLSHTDLIAA